MENTLTVLAIPVPPEPILEQAVGYRNDRNAHYLALWWEPCGDEAMVSDGFITFTGHWPTRKEPPCRGAAALAGDRSS